MRRRFPLLWLALHRRRRMLLVLIAGMVLFEVLIVVIAGTVDPHELFSGGSGANPPGAFKAFSGSTGDVSIASYPGLLGAGLVHPFWIAIQLTAIGSLAAAAVAADVEGGTIELLMVRPVSRERLLGERTAALLAAALAINAAAVLAVAIGTAGSAKLHTAVPLSGVFAAGLLGLGFALCVIGPALAVSAAARSRAQVLAAVIGIGAVGFAVNFAALAWHPLAPLRYISPFHYYAPGDALARGSVDWASLGILAGVGVIGIAAAFALLRRRDLAP
ncbi:ABC transporter permease subunit [Kitasatospora viridis]|uniref:ABC-2 type transport system permease protein n=1 Tax=Kitasatospora viridis TaxID=281105 RepID=A0A561UQD4_9ACTN|nr:ABC transporter permease subunit [Kitasatospora viridis]TWG01565.1 ABC-2 type transport system permease protein [Kitasatospora viridis]